MIYNQLHLAKKAAFEWNSSTHDIFTNSKMNKDISGAGIASW